MEQDPYDTPYGGAPSGDPWTPDELAQSQQWANQWYSSHQIPASYGTPDDIANSYVQFRRSGMSHADAMAQLQSVPSQLGWDKYSPGGDNPGPTPAPAPGPTPGPSAGPAPGPGPIPPTSAAPPPSGSTTYTPPPAYVPPPAFQYDPFNAPTGDDVLKDPGYQFELNQGIQAIGAKNAALGTLNTGGTIKDFMGYGQNLASTKYNDLFNRKLTEYGTNRSNALDTYNTNYGTQYKDPYTINYASQYMDPFANNLQGAQLGQQNAQFNAQLGQNNSQFNSNMDWAKFLQNYKATVTDPFSQKYSLLGLPY